MQTHSAEQPLDAGEDHARQEDAPDVSIVIPCLNEELTLTDAIGSARELLDLVKQRFDLEGEIVISDNGSTDGSVAIALAEGARVTHCETKGYGAALRAGFAAARGRYVVIGDSDGAHDFTDAVPMVERLVQGDDLCMGSRFRGTIEQDAMPWMNRYVGNPILTGTLNLFFKAGVSDAHCGLRAFTREALEQMRPSAAGMELASELIIKAALLGLKYDEVPVGMHKDGRDRPPHLRPWRDGWRHLRYLLMLSPGWLYYVPALVLGLFGVLVFALLLSQPSGGMVQLGPVMIGDHWMPLGAVAIGLSHLSLLMGLATTTYGIREGYRRASPRLVLAMKFSRLEYALLAGGAFVATGAAVFLSIIIVWQTREYGALERIREMIASATLVQLGMQTILGGFMLAVLRGNRSEASLTAHS